MDLGQPITIGALALNDAAVTAGGPTVGCAVETIDYSRLESRQVLNPYAKYDGLDVGGVWVTSRYVTMTGTIYGTDRADAYARLAILEAAMLPDSGTYGTATLSGQVPAAAGVLYRALTVVPQGLRYRDERASSGGADATPLAIPWTVQMIADTVITDTPAITDTWNRANAAVWGTSDSTLPWTEMLTNSYLTHDALAGHEVLSNTGRLALSAGVVRRYTGQKLGAVPAGFWTGDNIVNFKFRFSAISSISTGSFYLVIGAGNAGGTGGVISAILRISSHASWGHVDVQDTSDAGHVQGYRAAGTSKTDWLVDTWYHVKWHYAHNDVQEIKVWKDGDAEPGAYTESRATEYSGGGDYYFNAQVASLDVFVFRASAWPAETAAWTVDFEDLDIVGIN